MMNKFLPQVAGVNTRQQQQQQQQQQQHLQAAQQAESAKSFSIKEAHRHYLKVFIQTYHNLALLWDTSLKDYTNRDKRADAYQQLLPIYRHLKRDATLEDVKKKINTLRTNYRKELKVVEAAQKQGNHHQPTCWTFYELDFLRNTEKFLAVDTSIIKHETTTTSSSVYNTFGDGTHTGHFLDNAPCGYLMNKGNTPPLDINEMFHKSFGQQNSNNSAQQLRTDLAANHTVAPPLGLPGGIQSQLGASANQQTYPLAANANASLNPSKRLKTSASTSQQDEMLNIACDYLASTYPEEESIARTWTFKLKRLPKEQRMLAEKFINDILFEAESGSLHRGSMQLNALEPYVRFKQAQNDDSNLEKPQSPNAISTTTTNSTSGAIQSLEPATTNDNNQPHPSPIEVGSMIINDGSTPSASNDTDNSSRNTSAFTSYN